MRRTVLAALVGSVALVASFLVATPAQAAVSCAGWTATIVGTDRDDRINGTSGRDVIHGLDGDDVINGLGGDDIICGGEGADDLRGQAGNDRLYGNLDGVRFEEEPMDVCNMEPGSNCIHAYVTGDILRGNTGQDLLVPGWDNRQFDVWEHHRERDELRWDTAPRGVRVNLTRGVSSGDGVDRIAAAGPVRVIGSSSGDTIVGTIEADVLESGAGPDTIHGRDGNDALHPGSVGPGVKDVVFAGPGRDLVEGAGGSHELHGGPGDDTLRDHSAIRSDQLYGDEGDDRIEDTLVVAAGQVVGGGPTEEGVTDTFYPSFVSLRGSATWDMTSGEMVFTEPSAVTLMVNGLTFFGPDTYTHHVVWDITGTEGNDSVEADGTFRGMGGADRFSSGGGDDTFDGGEGEDRYDRDAGGTNTCTSVETPNGHCDVVLP